MSAVLAVENQPQQMPAVVTPMDMLQMAVSKGANLEQLQQLMDLQERWEKNQARKAYVEAMAQFKQNPPEILKAKQVAFGDTRYMHATLGDVTKATVEALARHGFSHRWDTDQQDGGQIVVTCVITHSMGHSESTTLKAGRDESGKKNNIQALASTVTYLQRYTLLAACGLATKDMPDDDGRGAEGMDEGARADHIAAIQAAADDAGLKKAFATAYRAADALKDKGAMEAFIAAKNARKGAPK